MSAEYMVVPGSIIKEYLDEYGITQKDLSAKTGISEKHISNVLNGNSRLTEEFALKLEKVMPSMPSSYWLNYESKYREYIARQNEIYNLEKIDLDKIARRYRFKEVFKGLNLTLVEQAIEMLKKLKISDFSNFDAAYQNMKAEFMEDGGDKEAIAVWMNLCEEEIEIQNDELPDTLFSRIKLKDNLSKFKDIANNDNLEASLKSCRKLCNSLGIYLVICDAITGCKVRGALTTYKGIPAIYISGRYKKHDFVWFAFIHEIAHLMLHYRKNDTFISYEDDVKDTRSKEEEANAFARDFFIDPTEYKKFTAKGSFAKAAVQNFAAQQRVTVAIVVGRLQHDGFTPYSQGTSWK